MRNREGAILISAMGFFGMLLGGLIGFLARPAVALIGQLPLVTVLHRGENLNVVERAVLGPAARASFNLLVESSLAGVVVGALAGWLIWRFLKS